MKIPRFYRVKYFIVDPEINFRKERHRLRWWIHYMTWRPLVRKLITTHGRFKLLKGTAFLVAHGCTGTEFLYSDHYKPRRVQDWIDMNDGKFNLLLIGCCNEQNYSIRSESSIVIHWDRAISLLDVMRSRGRVRVYIPKIGYIEHDRRRLKKIINLFQ